MTSQSTPLSRQMGERIVRVGIAVVGLLVLRGIVSVMPMLRSHPVYIASLPGLLLDDHQQNPLTPDQIQQALTSTQGQGVIVQDLLDEIQRIQRLNIVTRPLTDNRAYAVRLQNEILMDTGLALFPVTIAKAVIDTLILGLIALFGRGLTNVFRAGYQRLPDLGLMLSLGILTTVVAIAYYAYQGVAFPILFPDNGPIYGWAFLALILAPLVSLAVVVARNLDALTAVVMNSGSTIAPAQAVVGTRCAACGQTTAVGVNFCPQCGAAAPTVPSAANSTQTCPSCRAENPATAHFCRECGHAI